MARQRTSIKTTVQIDIHLTVSKNECISTETESMVWHPPGRVPARVKVLLIVPEQTGKPMQNGYVKHFNIAFREETLDAYIFKDIDQLQILADE